MSPFVIRITLRTPIILNPSIGLDGLLARRVFDRTGDLNVAHNKLPLARPYGIYAASQLFLEQPAPRSWASLVRSMKPGTGLIADMVRSDRGSRLSRVRTHRGDYRTLMNSYEITLPNAIWAFGTGKLSEIEELLSGLDSLGKKRNLGFGEIGSLEFEKSDVPIEAFGLVAADGSPARAVPVHIWSKVSERNDIDIDAVPIDLPRWQSPAVECAVPGSVFVSRHRVREMLG